MDSLFVALGIAVLTLLVLLLWFVPHLLQQQALRTASESAQLREMLLDMLNEQEAVTMRQAQLGTSISYLQDQLEHVVNTSTRNEATGMVTALDQEAVAQLDERVGLIQSQLQSWLSNHNGVNRARAMQDNESWSYLLGLLSAIQERVGQLSSERADAAAGLHASALLEELEQEMQHLKSISEDIATLQWRLRRSLHERESNVSVLRSRTSNGAH
jgi:hypothetical protein